MNLWKDMESGGNSGCQINKPVITDVCNGFARNHGSMGNGGEDGW